MASCLPGRLSRANRAATSLIRVEPFVMTTNWMTTTMANRIKPTSNCPCATNLPKASITAPAASVPDVCACVRISRVEATFKTRRTSVVTSSNEGNTLNSRGRRTEIVVNRINTDAVTFAASKRSSTTGGTGATSTSTDSTTRIGKTNPSELLATMRGP